MLRRSFIGIMTSGVLAALLGVRSLRAAARRPYVFRHGVASGDPLSDGVIIWTRVSGAVDETVSVHWEIGTDPELRCVLQEGHLETDASRDHTVKVDVRGLPAGRELYYRFRVGTTESPVGRTQTLPDSAIDVARFAVVSCSNYPYGFFHAYREIAKRSDIDAVIHLGDYIYEYGLGQYATEHAEKLDRVPDPSHEIITLSDYRRRHAQYKSDPDSQAMHAGHPMIAVWDDHELCNDAWHTGAENHGDGDGDWDERRNTAIRAYLEWMPIRVEDEGASTKIFREFRFGDLLSLIMLDTRMYGRDKQPELTMEMNDSEVAAVLGDPERQLLGDEQSSWFRGALERARASTWQVIGQQVLVTSVRAPDLEPLLDLEKPAALSRELLDYSIAMSKKNPPLLLDTWDGYDAARQAMLADIKAAAPNPVFLSGDLHTSIAGNVVPAGEKHPVAVEFMPTSVTSPGIAEYLPERHAGAVSDATLELNPNLAYMETDRRGWLHMTFTKSECIGEWHLLDGIRSADFTVNIDRRLAVAAGRIADGLYEA